MQKLSASLMAACLFFIGAGVAVCSEQAAQQEKIEERLEIVTAWKMMERLNLDRPTAEKILDLRRNFVSQRKVLKKELSQDFQKLKSLLGEGTDKTQDKELAQTLQDIRQKRKQLQMLMDEQYGEVSKLLSVRQQAELVLFLKDFHREIRSMLRSPPGPSGGPNPDQNIRPRGGRPQNGPTGPPNGYR